MSAQNSSTINVGVLGAANIAKKIVRGLRKTDGISLVAVGSRDVNKSRALIAEMGLGCKEVEAYGSYEEVLARSDVDAVYIPLPAGLHVPWVEKAVAAGKKGILLEKPIALNAADLERIITVCSEAGVQLMDGTMWMHNPRAQQMANILADKGSFGQVIAVNSTFCFCSSKAFDMNDVRVKKELDGLGALGDLGWYCVRGVLWAFGFELPESVTAHPGFVTNDEGVLTHVSATLLWPGLHQRRALIDCSFDRPLTQTLEVFGTHGTIHLRDFVIPNVEDQCSFISTTAHGFTKYDIKVATQAEEHLVYLPKPQESLMWEKFASCVRDIKAGGQPDAHWPRIAELTQRVLLAIEQSAQAGCSTVKLQ